MSKKHGSEFLQPADTPTTALMDSPQQPEPAAQTEQTAAAPEPAQEWYPPLAPASAEQLALDERVRTVFERQVKAARQHHAGWSREQAIAAVARRNVMLYEQWLRAEARRTHGRPAVAPAPEVAEPEPEPVETAPVVPPESSVERAIAAEQAERDREAADETAARLDAEGRYALVLQRNDHPKDGDVHDLRLLCCDLGITPEQLRDDLQLVQQARAWESAIGDAAKLQANWAAARNARLAIEARHKIESAEANKAEREARGACDAASSACAKLNAAAHRRPSLFDVTIKPARLRRDG